MKDTKLGMHANSTPMSIELLNMTGIADAWATPYAHRASLRTTFKACDPEQRKYFF